MLTGWLLAAYTFGALVVVMLDDRPWTWDELLTLAVWPVFLVIVWPVTAVQRQRATCRVCGSRYADRAGMLRHRARDHELEVTT